MANPTFYTRVQLKYDELATWVSKNPVLLKGEIAFVEVPAQPATATPEVAPPSILMKVGDGNTVFNALPWISAKAADVHSWAKKSESEFKTWLDAQGFATDADIAAIQPVLDGSFKSAEFIAEDKIRFTRNNGGTQDVTLPSAGTALGFVKTGGDVTITNGVITVNDDSHNHIIDNIDGLQQALNDIDGLINTARTEEIGWARIPTPIPDSNLPEKGKADSYGPSEDTAPKHGETFSVPYFTTDAHGRVTAASTKTITLPGIGDISAEVKDIENIANSALQNVTKEENGDQTLTFSRTKGDSVAITFANADKTADRAGFVVSGGDVEINNGVITVNDNSHSHIMSNITGLAEEFQAVRNEIKDVSDVANDSVNSVTIGTDDVQTITVGYNGDKEDTTFIISPANENKLGLVKQGGDVKIANGVITVTDGKSHTHTTSQITGLDTTLENLAKADEDFEERISTMETFWKGTETPTDVIDTLAEIVSYIESDESGATEMAASIKQNADDIKAINEGIGSSEDAATKSTVYGAIKKVADDLKDANDKIAESFKDVSLGADGLTITFTQQDGSTDKSITIKDTTYGVATDKVLGLVKSATSTDGDVEVDANGFMTVKDDSHNHIIDNVDGLRSELDDHDSRIKESFVDVTISGTTITFTQDDTSKDKEVTLPTAGTELGLVKSGGDITIADGIVTVNDNSHAHTIANVTGLEKALADIDDLINDARTEEIAWTRIPTPIPDANLPAKNSAGSYGPGADVSPAHKGTFSVPSFTVDDYGRVTAASTKTITLPSVDSVEKGIEDVNDRIDKLRLDEVQSNVTTPIANPNALTETEIADINAHYVIFNCGNASVCI